MSSNFEFFKTSMPDTRKADFCLACLDSSVFIDFNRTETDQITLARISFDGYGCCHLEGKAKRFNQEDSEQFIEEMNKEDLDQVVVARLVIKAIELNREHIWRDAIEEYGFK